MKQSHTEIAIIGAGLTGLTTAFWLTRAGKQIQIIERQDRAGGQIRTFQENGFYFSFGPDDLKFNLGYDFERETLRCTVEVMMDAKGTKVEYDKFEITQENRPKKEEKKEEPKKSSPNLAPTQPKVLERAVVENIKEHEDVL